jgi:hypothetical protein
MSDGDFYNDYNYDDDDYGGYHHDDGNDSEYDSQDEQYSEDASDEYDEPEDEIKLTDTFKDIQRVSTVGSSRRDIIEEYQVKVFLIMKNETSYSESTITTALEYMKTHIQSKDLLNYNPQVLAISCLFKVLYGTISKSTIKAFLDKESKLMMSVNVLDFIRYIRHLPNK